MSSNFHLICIPVTFYLQAYQSVQHPPNHHPFTLFPTAIRSSQGADSSLSLGERDTDWGDFVFGILSVLLAQTYLYRMFSEGDHWLFWLMSLLNSVMLLCRWMHNDMLVAMGPRILDWCDLHRALLLPLINTIQMYRLLVRMPTDRVD